MAMSGQHRRTTAVAAAALAAVALCGCGSSSPGHKSSSSSQHPGASSSATLDAAAVAAIKNAYAKFFAPDTPEQVSLGLLQNGQAFKATIEQQAKGNLAQKSSAKVSSVSYVSATTAKVVFSILVSGKAVLPNQPGYAVRENGTWKVSEHTFCGLLTLEGGAPAECKSATATTVPK